MGTNAIALALKQIILFNFEMYIDIDKKKDISLITKNPKIIALFSGGVGRRNLQY